MSWTPPDGAHLADLDERRAWLSRVEIVYALPRSGVLALLDDGASLALGPGSLVATVAGDRREHTLATTDASAAELAWRDLWLCTDDADHGGDGRVVLLHHHGLFAVRRGAEALAILDAALAPLLRR